MRAWSHKKNDFYEISFNYRMTEFSAISLLSKLKFLKNDIKRRINISELYKKHLKTNSYSHFNKKIKKHSFHIFAIRVNTNKRLMIIKDLKKKGIDTNIHYPYSLSKLKVFKNRKKTYTPISNKICNELISLPIYPELEDKKIIYTSKSRNRILK